MVKMSKSAAVKAAQKGKDLGKKGKAFGKIAKEAAKKYGSKEIGEKIAGKIFWEKQKKNKL